MGRGGGVGGGGRRRPVGGWLRKESREQVNFLRTGSAELLGEEMSS